MSKKRAPNFSLNEMLMIVEELEDKPDLVSGRLGGLYKTTKDIRNAWDDLAKSISSVGSGYCHSGEEIKKKWKDLKSTTKLKAAQIESYNSGTGGGPPSDEYLSELELKIVALLGPTTLKGVGFDSARHFKVKPVRRCLNDNVVVEAGTSSTEFIQESEDLDDCEESSEETECLNPSISDVPLASHSDSFDLNKENWVQPKIKSSTPRVIEHRQRKRKLQEVQDEEMLSSSSPSIRNNWKKLPIL